MDKDSKNIKISSHHHDILKKYCEQNGLKIYKVLEKLIDGMIKSSKKDNLYGEN